MSEADLTGMVENLIAAPDTFPLNMLEKTTVALLHDAVRRAAGWNVLSTESTDVRGNWFAYGALRAVKVRRPELENTIRNIATSIGRKRVVAAQQAEQAERQRPERDLRAALESASPELLKVMWTAMQQFVDNQDECAEEPSAEVKLVEPLIEKFDAYFASKGE